MHIGFFKCRKIKKEGIINKKGIDENMTERIWTRRQYSKLSILQKKYRLTERVVAEIYKIINILDECYRINRDVDKEDGGYVFLILPEQGEKLDLLYLEVLKKHHLDKEDAEFKDIIYDDEILQWHSDLFLVSSDYMLNIIYYTKRVR